MLLFTIEKSLNNKTKARKTHKGIKNDKKRLIRKDIAT